MRVKTGPTRRRRHKKVLKQAKGFRLARSRHYKAANETVLHAGDYAYMGRKLRKRDFRRLWITRISAALGNIKDAPSYSVFMHALKKADISLNRKMLSEIAINDSHAFENIVNKVYSK